MFDTLVKYAPIIGVLFILFLFALWLRGGKKAKMLKAALNEQQSMPPRYTGTPTMQQPTPTVGYQSEEPTYRRSSISEVRSRPKTIAERQAEWDARALAMADEREAEINKLRALDMEETQLAALREESRKASKSTNALIGKLQVDPTAGPLTQAMAMGDALQEILRTAAIKRDSAPK